MKKINKKPCLAHQRAKKNPQSLVALRVFVVETTELESVTSCV